MRNSSLVEWSCAENSTGLNSIPKLGIVEVRNERIEGRMVQSFKDLQVYKRSYELSLKVYEQTKTYPREERYGITSQIQRASISIPLNLAEGYGKHESATEFKRYIRMALGSANEMEVLLSLSRDLGYMQAEASEEMIKQYTEIGKMLYRLGENWK